MDIIPESKRGQEIIKHQIYIIFHNIFLYAKFNMARYPAVIMAVANVFSKKKDLLVSKNTDIVIEGFPRSGNSFAFTAFKQAQNKELKIAHHFHLPFQIIYACKNNIPCIVVIRDPLDVITSYLIFNPYLKPATVLRYYILFYKTILYCKDEFITANFNDIVNDFGSVIKRFNEKYNTDYHIFTHTPEAVQNCFDEIRRNEIKIRGNRGSIEYTLPAPSDKRDKLKPVIKKELQKGRYELLLKRAFEVYNNYIS